MAVKIPCTYKIVDNVIEIIPNNCLDDFKEYTININELLKDIYGQSLQKNNIDYTFKTKDIDIADYSISFDDKSAFVDIKNIDLSFYKLEGVTDSICTSLEFSEILGDTDNTKFTFDFEQYII